MITWDDLITIGRMVKPQGRHGEILVECLSDRPGRFEALEHAYVPGPNGSVRKVSVSNVWPHKGRFVLKLEGVDSIDAAEGYRGLDVRVAEAELEKLPPGSYYHYQLKGLEVVDESSKRVVGRVHDLLETGAAVVLVIKGEDGETLIPLADEFVKVVDLQGHRMVVRVPETYHRA